MKVFTGAFFLIVALQSCAKKSSSSSDGGGGGGNGVEPAVLTSSVWTPNVTGVSSANFKQSNSPVTVETKTVTGAPLLRVSDPWAADKEVTVNLGSYEASDFGPNGSLTLVADIENFPFAAGGAYPVLVSFTTTQGSEREWINLARSGSSGDCRASGLYTCIGGLCDPNDSCTVQSPSAFKSRNHWEQHQIHSFGYTSVNRFPVCESSTGPWSGGDCDAAVSGPMPTGSYVAKYVLLTDLTIPVSTSTATLKVKVVKKTDAAARNTGPTNGALNLNVILVGDQNISDAATEYGAQNLNNLFQELNDVLKDNSGVGIGSITAYDWTNANGGDEFSSAELTLLGDLFKRGSLGVSNASDGKSVNVFIVSEIPYGSTGITILGISGAISGPSVHGTSSSGLAFASFNSLLDYNVSKGCVVGNCPRSKWDADFIEMGATIAHEIGHYLGLNHPSERRSDSGPQEHDALSDTPVCAARVSGGQYVLDARACIQDASNTLGGQTCEQACPNYFTGGNYSSVDTYCGNVSQCQFNHLMWYTTKNRTFNSGPQTWSEDGNLISNESSAIVQWNALVQ